MTNLLKICGISIILLAAIAIVKQVRSDLVFTIRIASILTLTLLVIGSINPIIEYAKKLSDGIGASEYSTFLLKALGITLMIKIISDICRDMNEGTIATYVETLGRLELILLSIPLIDKILGTISGLL